VPTGRIFGQNLAGHGIDYGYFTQEKLFAGRVPNSPEEAFKTASLMIGISAMTFAKNRRLDNWKRAKAGLKVLTPKSPVADLFWRRARYYASDIGKGRSVVRGSRGCIEFAYDRLR
jgi:hypothetical protein